MAKIKQKFKRKRYVWMDLVTRASFMIRWPYPTPRQIQRPRLTDKLAQNPAGNCIDICVNTSTQFYLQPIFSWSLYRSRCRLCEHTIRAEVQYTRVQKNTCPLAGSERIELRCIACSALNMILISDVQAHHYRSILLQKDQSLLRVLSSVLKLEGLDHCDRMLQLKLLTEACALIYTLCSDDRVKSEY